MSGRSATGDKTVPATEPLYSIIYLSVKKEWVDDFVSFLKATSYVVESLNLHFMTNKNITVQSRNNSSSVFLHCEIPQLFFDLFVVSESGQITVGTVDFISAIETLSPEKLYLQISESNLNQLILKNEKEEQSTCTIETKLQTFKLDIWKPVNSKCPLLEVNERTFKTFVDRSRVYNDMTMQIKADVTCATFTSKSEQTGDTIKLKCQRTDPDNTTYDELFDINLLAAIACMYKDYFDMSFECDDNYLRINFYSENFDILFLIAPLKFEKAGATEISEKEIEDVEKVLTAVLTNNYLNVQQLWECALASAKPLLTQYFANQQQMIELHTT